MNVTVTTLNADVRARCSRLFADLAVFALGGAFRSFEIEARRSGADTRVRPNAPSFISCLPRIVSPRTIAFPDKDLTANCSRSAFTVHPRAVRANCPAYGGQSLSLGARAYACRADGVRLPTRLLTRGEAGSEVSRDEITALATAGQRLGVVEEDEKRIVTNLFRLPETEVKKVMTPRTVIEHVSKDQSVSDALDGRKSFPFSRLVVTGASIDDVLGFAATRDLMLAALRGEGDRLVSEFVRELPLIDEAMDLSALFDLLLGQEAHIALVTDAYGGTAGLVTMEDLLETLLGTEIVDEHDEEIDLQEVARRRAERRTDRGRDG